MLNLPYKISKVETGNSEYQGDNADVLKKKKRFPKQNVLNIVVLKSVKLFLKSFKNTYYGVHFLFCLLFATY